MFSHCFLKGDTNVSDAGDNVNIVHVKSERSSDFTRVWGHNFLKNF
ncbi:hypothetical protein TAMA11512_05620 [Selenomonas sp. TAMA-11512]|nr:hypothetical protein TAMA11512_05620 [Selenomonas sp. TAMA-11512]